MKTLNNYTTDIPLFNLLKADSKEWEALNSELETVNWNEDIISDDLDTFTDAFINIIEEKVKIAMKNRSNEKTSHDSNGDKYSSKNLIPKNVRKLFKKKCKLSKQLRVVTDIERCIIIRDNIKNVDFEIQNAYEIRRRTKEQKTFEKSRENKYYIYQYIKRINKSGFRHYSC